MDKFKSMTYKEFYEYCNDRACDGRWSFEEAVFCLSIIDRIKIIQVKFLGITLKKRTEQARQAVWEEIVKEFVS